MCYLHRLHSTIIGVHNEKGFIAVRVGLQTFIPAFILCLHDVQELLHELTPPPFCAQGPGLERRVIRDCIGSRGRIYGVPKVPHVPQNLIGPPRRHPQPSSRPIVHEAGVGDRLRPHITVPVIAAPKDIFHPPEEGLVHTRGFIRARLGERVQGGVVGDPGRPDVPVASLPQILHLVEECHGPIGGVLPTAPGPGGYGRPVCDSVGPRPNVAVGVLRPHTVEDPQGHLGRSLPAAAGQARDDGVVAQVRRLGPLVLL